jgi:hypothetical protein
LCRFFLFFLFFFVFPAAEILTLLKIFGDVFLDDDKDEAEDVDDDVDIDEEDFIDISVTISSPNILSEIGFTIYLTIFEFDNNP